MKIFKVEEFDIPLYEGKVTFILFLDTWDKVMTYLKEKGFKTKGFREWEYVHGLQFSQMINGSRKFVVLVKANKKSGETLVHELFHLTQDILEYKGVNFIKEDANEAYAYLIGVLYGKMEKLIK